jgi:hypothetical protein
MSESSKSISGSNNNKLLSSNTLYEYQLYNRTRKNERCFVLVYRVYFVGSDNIMMCMYGM